MKFAVLTATPNLVDVETNRVGAEINDSESHSLLVCEVYGGLEIEKLKAMCVPVALRHEFNVEDRAVL
jgi:hypothetical protein